MFTIIVHYLMLDSVRYANVESVQEIIAQLNLRQVSRIEVTSNYGD